MKCIVCLVNLPIHLVEASSKFDCPNCNAHYEHTCELVFRPSDAQLYMLQRPQELLRWKGIAFGLFEQLSTLGRSRDFTKEQEKAYVELLREKNEAADLRANTLMSELSPADAKFLREYVDSLRSNVTC